MTPAERQLVTDLFDRLATLEDAERDAEAERLINDGLRQAPNAVYALVQSVLVQDEALKRADARIRELEAGLGIEPESRQPMGFLDSMRETVFGERRGGSVPSVRPGDAPMGTPAGLRTGAQPMPQEQPGARGGSFLGTAAAAAAGVIGGSLLLDGIRSMTGQRHGGFGMADPAAAAGRETGTPWGNTGGGELARQAGLEDISRSGAEQPGETRSAGLFGDGGSEPAEEHYADLDDGDADYDDDFGLGGDDGGGDGGTD
ncbi:MAG: DUF2076 domain-containing protein [Xanthobacteraceae bacterium]